MVNPIGGQSYYHHAMVFSLFIIIGVHMVLLFTPFSGLHDCCSVSELNGRIIISHQLLVKCLSSTLQLLTSLAIEMNLDMRLKKSLLISSMVGSGSYTSASNMRNAMNRLLPVHFRSQNGTWNSCLSGHRTPS